MMPICETYGKVMRIVLSDQWNNLSQKHSKNKCLVAHESPYKRQIYSQLFIDEERLLIVILGLEIWLLERTVT